MDKALIDKNYVLEKFPGKGGWTYARIPEILQDKHAPFGWVRVKGSIDGVEIKSYHLMPMGNGSLFLPVKAEIRKKIRKKAGDEIRVILYADRDPVEIPAELHQCLLDAPKAHDRFMKWTQGKQKGRIDWIYGAKSEQTRADRIWKLLEELRGEERLKG